MKISSLTDIGNTREMNQDYLYSSEESVGKLPNLFLVADGMGGHKAGEFASRYVVEHIVRSIKVRLGQMDPQSAKNHPDKNIITRAVGVSEKVKIDIFERQLRAGEYIILCSDGLTNMVEDSVILQILHGAGSLSDKAERLIELANKNGGKDNITVIIIEPNSDEVAEC